VRARDGEAWRRLVALYGPLVYGWCRRRGLDAEAAADVGQEVFLAVFRGLDGFRRQRPGDSFRGWLHGIAAHKVADYGRRQAKAPDAAGGSAAQRQLAEVLADEGTTSASGTAPSETAALLHRALALVRGEFEERTWQAFWRVTVEGQAPAEVARALGLSVNAVYIARSRVLRRLRDEFGEVID
jgi:RNA polymerase sigma-70 factor (ECF subfamily)